MKFIKTILLLLIFTASHAIANSLLDIESSVRSVCMSPDQSGKYWEVKGSADARVGIKILGPTAGISGEFSKGEWEGIQRVLREEQASDNDSYRKCVMKITPIFVSGFNIGEKQEITPLITKENSFTMDLTSYDEGDLADEIGKDLQIKRINNTNVVAGYQSNPAGQLELKTLDLKDSFKINIEAKVYNSIDMILRTRDENPEHDIRIKIRGHGYDLSFGPTTKDTRHLNYKSQESNLFAIDVRGNAVKLYINNDFIATQRATQGVIYNKLLINEITPNDHIYTASGYNIMH